MDKLSGNTTNNSGSSAPLLSVARAKAKHFRLATPSAFYFFRHSSCRMTVRKSKRTQSLRLGCAPSGWVAEKHCLTAGRCRQFTLHIKE